MSNELLYEIFEYIDTCHVYETFSTLNSRFQYLLVYSSMSLKVNFSFTCKSTFQYRCKHIIKPNIHRIISFRLSNYLMNDLFFELFTIDSSFVRLESLTLTAVNIDNVIQLLTSLICLPRFYTLSFIVNRSCLVVKDMEHIFTLIFRLPVLKYGKFLFGKYGLHSSLSIPVNNQQVYSPIEHLIIDSYCPIDQFNTMLSYTPRLRYFSCRYITSSESIQREVSIIPFYLTHLSFKIFHLSFDEFQLFIIKICSQLKRLRIRTSYCPTFLDANRWEWLISQHMKYLCIFDFKHSMCITTVEDMNVFYTMINQFTSSFWIERQWFFGHRYHLRTTGRMEFYSTKPYRLEIKHFQIIIMFICVYLEEINMNFFNLRTITYVHIMNLVEIWLKTFILKPNNGSQIDQSNLYVLRNSVLNAISWKTKISSLLILITIFL